MTQKSKNMKSSAGVIGEFAKKNNVNKASVIRHIKFFLIPGWRDPEFSSKEYEIERIKSKRRLFRRLLSPLAILGFGLIFFITFLAMYAPLLTPYTLKQVVDLSETVGTDAWLPPDAIHILGTSHGGFDLLARIIWGARTAIIFGFITICIASSGGIFVGTVAGYFGGRVDSVIMRVVDFIMIFPATVLVILMIQLAAEQNLLNMLIIFGMFGITGFSRLMRASVLQVKQELYIEAARTGGANKFKVMFKHVFANAISPIIVRFFGGVGGAILAFSGIAYLGFGDKNLPDWGTDISWASGRILSSIWASVIPGLILLIAVLGFMLVGDSLRDALDPKLKFRKGK
jgi:peptide/nickel transport system permease protein